MEFYQGVALPVEYARRLAEHALYKQMTTQDGWYWQGPVTAKSSYYAHITANNNTFRYFTHHSMIQVFLVGGKPGEIHCRMLGQPIPDDELFAIVELWKDLPHSAAVGKVIMDRADWLDDHPEYRGLSHKQKRKRVAPGQLEVGDAVESQATPVFLRE